MAENPPEIPEPLELLPSFERYLRGAKKSPHTIESYGDAVRAYARWAQDAGHSPHLTKDAAQDFILDVLEGRAPTTALTRRTGLRQFGAWWAADQGHDANPLAGLPVIHTDDAVIEPLTPDQITAFIAACKGTGFLELRDEAMFRFLIVTAARATETTEILLADTNIDEGTTIIRRGKGGAGRLAAFDPTTAYAIDRYLRKRRQHKWSSSPRLWLADRGGALTYDGMRDALGRRAEAAGIEGFHPHRCRHTGADRWLAAGGSEGGLMAIGGWTSRKTMDRYTKRRSAVRAIEESHRLNLGDF